MFIYLYEIYKYIDVFIYLYKITLIPMNCVINAQYRTSAAPINPEKFLSSSQSPNLFVYTITL